MSKEDKQSIDPQKIYYSVYDCRNDIKEADRNRSYIRHIKCCYICKEFVDTSSMHSFDLELGGGILAALWKCKIPCGQK